MAFVSAAQAPQERLPSFPAATQVIRVDVVVHNKDGKPVADLTAGDFQLFEDGREQRIESFSMETSGRGAVAAPVVAADGAREFDNRPGGRVSSATVVMLDRLNTRFEDQGQAKAQVVKFLGQIQADDRVGLYVLESGSVRVLHDFTSDASALIKALERHQARQSRELDASEAVAPETGDAQMDAFLATSFMNIRDAAFKDRLDWTVRALEAVARHLAGVRGRKNLVWVSSAFPLVVGERSPYLGSEDLRRAGRALTAASVAIYPVDARGLVGALVPGASATRPATRDASAVARSQFATMETTFASVDTMTAIADETGGRAFFNTNDIGSAVRRAVDDAQVCYVLGYAPTHGKWDGAFHQIKVKLRRGGLDVRHRMGYRAYPTPPAATGAKREAALFDLIKSPIDAMGLGLRVRVDAVSKSGEPLSLAVLIEPGSVTLRKNGPQWDGAFEIAIVQRLSEEKLFKSLDTTVELRLTDEQRERLLKDGIVVNRKVPLRDEAQRLHVVVRDAATGAVGSLSIPAGALRDTGGR